MTECQPLTRPLAEVEGLDGEVDAGGLGEVEAVLQRADPSVLLQEQAASGAGMGPLLQTQERHADHQEPGSTDKR